MLTERIELRRAYRMLSAIRDAMEPAVRVEYFSAICETEEEAQARHAMHSHRVQSAIQKTMIQPIS